MEFESFDEVVNEALEDQNFRTAKIENSLRRNLGHRLENARKQQGLSIRELAAAMDTSKSQVQRVLHKEQGGSLTLMTMCRAADALGMEVSIQVRSSEPRQPTKPGRKIINLSSQRSNQKPAVMASLRKAEHGSRQWSSVKASEPSKNVRSTS